MPEQLYYVAVTVSLKCAYIQFSLVDSKKKVSYSAGNATGDGGGRQSLSLMGFNECKNC